MLELLIVPALAGYGIVAISAPLGCFVVWKKMAYFGDTLAHATLLGVALSLAFQVSLLLCVIFTSLLIGLSLTALQSNSKLSTDTLLGILAHGSLALGLVAVDMMHSVRIDLMSYLFGDILAVFPQDLYSIYACVLFVGGILYWLWNPLIASTVHEELASVEGVSIRLMRFFLTILLAVTIAFSMKIIGILLITSLLIIPPATAQEWSKTPEQMVVLSIIVGFLGVTGGLLLAWYLNAAAGPSIVLCCFLLFCINYIFSRIIITRFKSL